jgi:hypothetical protein
LVSSISIAEREGEPEGISDVIRCGQPISGTNMAQRASEKRPVAIGLGQENGNFGVKPSLDVMRISQIFGA